MEKISLKKQTLRAYFVSDQQSPYFESEVFGRILNYVQQHPRDCNLKEVKNTLRIAFEEVQDLEQAITVLSELSPQPTTAQPAEKQ
jgi:transcription-repair coupling factor (superfamily II helicase)